MLWRKIKQNKGLGSEWGWMLVYKGWLEEWRLLDVGLRACVIADFWVQRASEQHGRIWRKHFLGRCKDPEEGLAMVCSSNGFVAGVVGVEGTEWSVWEVWWDKRGQVFMALHVTKRVLILFQVWWAGSHRGVLSRGLTWFLWLLGGGQKPARVSRIQI